LCSAWCQKAIERAFLALTDIVVLFMAGLIGIASRDCISSSWGERTPIFQMPAALIALPLSIDMALLALCAPLNLWHDHGRVALAVGAPFTALMTAIVLSGEFWLPLSCAS
jgi:TRAP-type C4-dicarboxylate transport system permease small subunit